MININKEEFFLIGISALFVILALFVIQPFIIPLIFTLLLAYILNPIYRKLLRKIKNKELTSAIFTIIIFLLIIIPITLISLNLIKELNQIDDTQIVSSLELLSNQISNNYNVNVNFVNQYNVLFEQANIAIQSIFYKIPEFIFQIFIILFFYYYFSKDYNQEIRFFKSLFNHTRFKKLKDDLEKLISAIVYGQIFVRAIQAAILTIGFVILGIDGAIIWGIITFFAAFIPIIGTGIIWGPIILIQILSGDYMVASLVFILGFFVSTIDNFLLPYMISEKTNIGPVITLISILGGIQLFGLYGIILGPFFVGILVILLEDIFQKLKIKNPNVKRYIWSKEEREKLASLNTDIARKKFIDIINEKHLNKINKTNN